MAAADRTKITKLALQNFLSYRSAELTFEEFGALVGRNASGKSNLVAALKLLREIPLHGLPAAIARRGGFDQLRHRSQGRPYDPSLRIEFLHEGSEETSFYEIKLGASTGKRYTVKSEAGEVITSDGSRFSFALKKGEYELIERYANEEDPQVYTADRRVPAGQSALSVSMGFLGPYLVSQVLGSLQTIEINPSKVSELQDPSSTREFEPDGSNTASIFDTMGPSSRQSLIDELSGIVSGIEKIEIRRMADKVTLVFFQSVEDDPRHREFYAKQISDGTLRAFAILLATHQPTTPVLTVIEEPEIAIHLGALRTLVEVLQQESEHQQILITTHSADILDAIDVDQLRVVWSNGGESRVAVVAEHTKGPIRDGLISPGELLRADALDPAT